MSDPTTRPPATEKTTPEQLSELQGGIAELIAYVRSRETTKNLSGRSFSEILQAHIFSLVGDDQDLSSSVQEALIEGRPESIVTRKVRLYGRQIPTRLSQVEKIAARKDLLVAAVKKIDPSDVTSIREEK